MTLFLKDQVKCKSDPASASYKFAVKMKKNFFTKRKNITFYSKKEKHKFFEKIKIFYQTLSLRIHIPGQNI